MPPAGMLLTGGSSRRMGSPKALLPALGEPGVTWSQRTGLILASVTEPTIEVGSGFSDLPHIEDLSPGRGPLAAIVSGLGALAQETAQSAVLVVATDLPYLSVSLLSWLASHPAPGSVVPVVDGRIQPLCARYCWSDLSTAATLVAQGKVAMRDLVAAIPAHLAHESEWLPFAGDPRSICDVDEPRDLERLKRSGRR